MAELDQQIINDLMDKCSADVRFALRRTLEIAPHPHLPIATAAGATVIGFMSRYLEEMAGGKMEAKTPDPECVLLAGLMCARMAIDPATGIARAYADFEILKKSSAHQITQTPD